MTYHPPKRGLTPAALGVLAALRAADGAIVPFGTLEPGSSGKASPTLRYVVSLLRAHGYRVEGIHKRGYYLRQPDLHTPFLDARDSGLTGGHALLLAKLAEAKGAVVPYDDLRPGSNGRASQVLRNAIAAIRKRGHPIFAAEGQGYCLRQQGAG